jgi:adenylate cyclase class IV
MIKLDKITSYLEYEYKYRLPDKTDFIEFREFIDTLINKPRLGFCSWDCGVRSYDHYFSKQDDFLRYRAKSAGSNELTIKKKLKKDVLSARAEVNLKINSTKEDTEEFAKLLGYKFDFSLDKYADTWNFEEVQLSHYAVLVNDASDEDYDQQGDLGGHFVEIEVLGAPRSGYYKILNKWEKLLKPFGVSKNNRVNKSLFELYRCSVEHKNLKVVDQKEVIKYN